MTNNLMPPGFATATRFLGNKISQKWTKEQRLCVINYHRVLEASDPLLDSEPDLQTFTWQMALLADCFNVMPLSEGVQALYEGCLPPRAVCITFDDGYRSTYELAHPVLQQFGLPATVFVTSGHVGTDNMWNDKIIETIRSYPGRELDLRKVDLGVYKVHDTASKKDAIDKLIRNSKYLGTQGRHDLMDELDKLMEGQFSVNQMLTSDMILQMFKHGFSIGAHTVSHPILARMDDDAARQEITECKSHLETLIGKPIEFFAYPNGKVITDFDERHVSMVRDAGYVASFTTTTGASTRQSHRFQIPRGRPWDKTPTMFAIRLLRWLAGEV